MRCVFTRCMLKKLSLPKPHKYLYTHRMHSCTMPPNLLRRLTTWLSNLPGQRNWEFPSLLHETEMESQNGFSLRKKAQHKINSLNNTRVYRQTISLVGYRSEKFLDYFSGGVQPLLFRRISQSCEKRLLAPSCLSVRPSVRPSVRNNAAPAGRILMKFDTWVFFTQICRESLSWIRIWLE
jgi:hypothetical protein